MTVVRPDTANDLSFVQSDRAVTESRPEILGHGRREDEALIGSR